MQTSSLGTGQPDLIVPFSLSLVFVIRRTSTSLGSLFLAVAAALGGASCTQIKAPDAEPFFAETKAPKAQELRWSNGRSPRTLDPAQAAAAPETDITRALFEGLTELDPRSLEAVPAVAAKWEHSDDLRVWTFHLRDDAVWSNGERVTAGDFVASWKRLRELGEKTAHRDLLLNLKGFAKTPHPEPAAANSPEHARGETAERRPDPSPETTSNSSVAAANSSGVVVPPDTLRVTAEDETTLRVELVHPDPDFPKLVAHPIFRPVFGGTFQEKDPVPEALVTNGPFKIGDVRTGLLTLDRSDSYWDRDAVKLDRVTFVAAQTPETALEAYREGDVDAVTNAEFSATALKLLTPYEDFRRNPHSALNLYEFNLNNEPFNDRRVRKALAMAIQREKLSESELGGTSWPADTFLPFGTDKETRISQDVTTARNLLDEAGFPGGEGFPVIRLLINRNDTQQRVAKAVAEMWKQNLNVLTEIIVKDNAELQQIKTAGDYDLVRRGIVLPTADETANFIAIFHSDGSETSEQPMPGEGDPKAEFRTRTPAADLKADGSAAAPAESAKKFILSESSALYEVKAIPLYFPTAYSLVKPYVKGFDSNVLDSPSIKDVSIDENWRPPQR